MKSLTHYIQEKLVIKKNKDANYKYFPKTKAELKELIKSRIEGENRVDLNDIDVSNITDMSELICGLNFNGDISKWDVSNVTNMARMFYDCELFNKDISSWDVSNVTNMTSMFYNCKNFNQDISTWDVSNVTDMYGMFELCESFNQDISTWDVSKVEDIRDMFSGCKSFNQDISSWDFSNSKYRYSSSDVFNNCPIENVYKPKFRRI